MDRLIYVVRGTTGEYSNRKEWAVRAYAKKSDAQHLVLRATEWFKKQLAGRAPMDACFVDGIVGPSPYDPNFEADYTGTSYYVEEVPFENET